MPSACISIVGAKVKEGQTKARALSTIQKTLYFIDEN